MKAILLVLTFVPLQFVKAQTLITLAPQSNCPNNIYVDYIAKAKVQQQQLIVIGELVVAGDSISQIIFNIEKSVFSTKNSIKENNGFIIEKVKWEEQHKQQFYYCNKLKKLVEINTGFNRVISKNQVTVYINLLEKPIYNSLKRDVDLILVCTTVYKNGCMFIKKQKIIFEY